MQVLMRKNALFASFFDWIESLRLDLLVNRFKKKMKKNEKQAHDFSLFRYNRGVGRQRRSLEDGIKDAYSLEFRGEDDVGNKNTPSMMATKIFKNRGELFYYA